MAASAGCVLVSNLRRAKESAAWLAASKDVWVDPELREAALPDSLALSIPLSPRMWVALARVADRLGALAAVYGSVITIGHGMFNRFVARQLRRRGWRGPKVLPRAYWAAAEFDNADSASS
jgi:hypothetical protein